MHMKSRARTLRPLIALESWGCSLRCGPRDRPAAQAAPPQNPPARVTLDEAIDLALQHNHSLQAARTTILQNQAQEITANLRPNPVALVDEQYMPFFSPSAFTSDYIDQQRVMTWASPT